MHLHAEQLLSMLPLCIACAGGRAVLWRLHTPARLSVMHHTHKRGPAAAAVAANGAHLQQAACMGAHGAALHQRPAGVQHVLQGSYRIG
jgi:hypothetical protein